MQLRRSSAGRSGSRGRGSRKQPDLYAPFRGSYKPTEPELPRRCLVIKRTHPEEGVERTELRLVTYQKSGTRIDQAHVLMDAARYLQERADDAECDDTRGGATGSRCTYSSTSTDRSGTSSSKAREGKSSTSYCSTDVPSKESKAVNVADQKKLRESLENLVMYFARRADETGDREWSVITSIAERLLFDVSECIQCERPMTRELLSRIKGLNRLAKQATLKRGRPGPTSLEAGMNT